MKFSKRLLFWVILLLFLTALGCFLGSTPKSSSAARPKDFLTLNVVPFEKRDVEITSEFVGFIKPIQSVELKPNVSGYIDEIWVEGGQNVSTGQKLVKIDQRDYAAQLAAAQASVAQAKADFLNAESYYQRLQKAGKKAVSESSLDDAKAKFLSAKASLQQALAEEQRAQTLYDYTVLNAPIDGIVGDVHLTKGNYVSPSSSALFSIVQINPIRVEFAISDKDYLSQMKRHPNGALFEGETIRLRLSDGSLYPYAGQFQFADNQLEKTTNSISVYADFQNEDRKLMANSYVDILVSQKEKNSVLIPQNYAVLDEKGAFVYTLKDGKISKVPLIIRGYYKNSFVTANSFEKNEFLIIDKLSDIPPETHLSMKINPPEKD